MEIGGSPNTGVITPVDPALFDALAQWSTGFDHILKMVQDGALGSGDHVGAVQFAQLFEQARNRTAQMDHAVIADAERQNLAGALSQPNMRQVLIQALGLSPAEASRRVAAAKACGPRTSMLGQELEPIRPVLAAAQQEGAVSPEQVHIITRALGKVDRPGFDPAKIALGEEVLTNFASTMGCKDLRVLAERIVDRIDPDGTLPDEKLNQDRRHFDLKKCSDGMYAGEFRLTGECGAKLQALLQPLSKPRLDSADKTVTDDRTFGQRQHDALEELCDKLLRSREVVSTGGTPATVIVTIDFEDLLNKLGYGVTSDGTIIPVRDVLRMATEAEIIPTIMDGKGAALNLGRSRRIASHSQTLALIARDHGCSFPGCDRPPEWCERHHIKDWALGGLTDLNNLTLLCRYHHHNFAQRGWVCRMRADGLPEWVPPKWVDRDQKPLQNSRIIAHLLAEKQQRTRRE